MTRRDKFSTKIPTRMIYTDVASKCPICLKLHNKSKKFGTPYHLLYHLKNHNSDDELSSKISVIDVKQTVNHICKAIGWRMFFDNIGVRCE
jgi:hypothetical protein